LTVLPTGKALPRAVAVVRGSFGHVFLVDRFVKKCVLRGQTLTRPNAKPNS
jgi:hypothetical protein